jgi:hypothetical protein
MKERIMRRLLILLAVLAVIGIPACGNHNQTSSTSAATALFQGPMNGGSPPAPPPPLPTRHR